VTRILIGAGSRVARLSLESVVATDAALTLVGSFSLRDALARLEELQPDVALLDAASAADEAMLFSLDAEDAPASAALVVLIDDAGNLAAPDALRAGVRALLPRRATAEEIVAAIQAAAAGLVAFHPAALDAAFAPIASEEADGDPSDRILTPREIEVLRMIADGLGNKQIASQLGISDHTVKFHIASVFAKLGAANRAEAVAIGVRRGLLMV